MDLKGSKHDLSVTGPGPTKAASEREICVFCHTPHGSSSEAPLWNRYHSKAKYIPYTSTTLKATVGQPTGDSKLCLSCHDGTVALGMLRNRKDVVRFAGGVTTMPKGSANLGTDLTDDHPISFKYNTDLVDKRGELKNPETLDKAVRLDHDGMMQCTSCHDAHDNKFGKFLVQDNYASALCLNCHEKDFWGGSIHRTSKAKWSGGGKDPWPNKKGNSVAANGCENCHKIHTAGSTQRLLKFKEEEENCFPCHNGNVAGENVERDFRKISRHNVIQTTEVHDPIEPVSGNSKHVECVDCHNPHAVKTDEAEAPVVSGALLGVRGIDRDGNGITQIANQYELCYRCHADADNYSESLVNRLYSETNVRNEFGAQSTSYHPVQQRGMNDDVPSLIDPLDETSMIYCTDCHSSDSGLRGPHGSRWKPILVDRMETADYMKESASAYALCYMCHNRNSILNNDSFPHHRVHLEDAKASCSTCHDPHGSRDNPHLINFSVDYVTPFEGKIEYQDNGAQEGSCTLICHERDHDEEEYGP